MAVANILRREPAQLSEGWQIVETSAGAVGHPRELPATLQWAPAPVPGTAASALTEAGLWNPAGPRRLHGSDFWYRTRLHGYGREILRFQGLATLATVWLNGEEILASSSMFMSHDVPVHLKGDTELHICFRALDAELSKTHAPGRWRPRMIQPSTLRHVRTTVLGHMPGWCPNVDAIGPWRPIERITLERLHVGRAHLNARLEDDSGRLEVTLEFPGNVPEAGILECAGRSCAFVKDRGRSFSACLTIPKVEAWWPHTHGTPALHAVRATFGETVIGLGRTGFRRIEVDRGADGKGFGLIVNGVPVFCRGAVWSSADLAALPCTRKAYAPWLTLARDGNMNMIRVPGTTVYEARAFYELCDELGLLVWQDFMFANFDYPASDDAFVDLATREVGQFLDRTQANPCIAVLCGGSEVYQQAAMLGLPQKKYLNPIFETVLPEAVARLRPGTPYVPGSPSGGALPFVVDEGQAHYFGVGGYKRPLSDARTANVRFASECLAFANVPPEVTNPAYEPPLSGVQDPRWKPRIPRDAGSSWDFEDIRDHYLEQTFGVHAADLRCRDPGRYLELSRAAVESVFENVLAEWTRARSPTRGALALMLQDLQPGAGWGVIASCGAPKSPYYAMKRAFEPVRVAMTDEGVNGLALHLTNETAQPQSVALALTALRNGKTPVLNVRRNLVLAPRSVQELSAYELLGSFFDLNYAYRFQPPQHDAVVAALFLQNTHEAGAAGTILSEAFFFPVGQASATPRAAIEVSVTEEAGEWILQLMADRLARFVHIVDEAYIAADDWFHLVPGRQKRIRLAARSPAHRKWPPRGLVRALDMMSAVSYGPAA